MENIDPTTLPEFDDHKHVVFLNDPESKLRGFIAIHRSRGDVPSFGATRLWAYDSDRAALRDALSLSRLMSYKAALANVPYGGAKGVVIMTDDKNPRARDALLRRYADEVQLLGGKFITGTDAGMNKNDLPLMRERTEHMVGVEGDPSIFTALGVVHAMKVILLELFGSPSFSGRTVAIQGLGKIGSALLAKLYGEGASLCVADIDDELVREIKTRFPEITMAPPAEIAARKVDIFAPCAMSGAITSELAPRLRCKAVVGGANSQLADSAVGDSLYARGILYAPDYVVNAGGLICVVDEYEHGNHEEARVRRKVDNISATLQHILRVSKNKGEAPHRIADQYAERIINADL